MRVVKSSSNDRCHAFQPESSYSAYLFKAIYVLPTFPHPFPYKAALLRERFKTDQIFTIEEKNHQGPLQSQDVSGSKQLIKSLRTVLSHALTQGFLRILLISDRAVPLIDFDTSLRERTTGPAAAPWDVMTFRGEAYALTAKAVCSLLNCLAGNDARPEEAVRQLTGSLPCIHLGHLISNPSLIKTADNPAYFYNHDPCNKTVSVCCVSKRPEFLENIFLNYKRQLYPEKELILVMNGTGHDPELAKAMAVEQEIMRFHLLTPPRDMSLGKCLNLGIRASNGFYWCKIDDDDYYGATYLSEAQDYISAFPNPLVGKSRMHVFDLSSHKGFLTTDKEYARLDFPRQTGATIFCTKDLAARFPFENLSSGEDTAFFKSLFEAGISFTDSTLDNYVYVRHGHNTSDYESHLSAPWQLETSTLYREFLSSYPYINRVAMSRVPPERFGPLFDHKFSRVMAGKQFPRIIHQIWLGPRPRPDHWMNSWKYDYIRQFPHWQYRLWSEKDFRDFEFTRSRAYQELSTAGKSDLLRYKILHQYGGIYIDSDSLFINSTGLDPLVPDVQATGLLLAEEPFQPDKGLLIANGVMAALPGNPLLDYLLNRAIARVNHALENGDELVAWQMTGPLMVTQVIRHIQTVKILPHIYFYPEYWNTSRYWSYTKNELEQTYPHSIMFQFGLSTVEGEI